MSVDEVDALPKAGRRRYTVQIADIDRGYTDDVEHGVVIVDAERFTGKILRAAIVGPSAAEIIGIFTFAIDHGIGLRKMFGTVHPYPGVRPSRRADRRRLRPRHAGAIPTEWWGDDARPHRSAAATRMIAELVVPHDRRRGGRPGDRDDPARRCTRRARAQGIVAGPARHRHHARHPRLVRHPWVALDRTGVPSDDLRDQLERVPARTVGHAAVGRRILDDRGRRRARAPVGDPDRRSARPAPPTRRRRSPRHRRIGSGHVLPDGVEPGGELGSHAARAGRCGARPRDVAPMASPCCSAPG